MVDERWSGICERSARPAALVIVIVLHASVLLVSQPRMRLGDVSRMSIWLDLEAHSDVEAEIEPVRTTQNHASSSTPERALPDRAPGAPAPILAPPAPATDWSLTGAIAAEAAVADLARKEGYRPLGPRIRKPEASEGPPSIYTAPKHELGDSEFDPLNYDIVWHSDRCYTELGKTITPRADARLGFPNVMKCRLIGIGKKEPRGDLFEHLKRDKKPPP